MDKQTIKLGGGTKRSKFEAFEVKVPAFGDMKPEALAFIQAYGLRQYLADGMAGAATIEDAKAGVGNRVENITTGEFKRAKGEGLGKPDTEEQRAIKLSRQFIRDHLKAQDKTADKDKVNEAAAKLLASTEGNAGAKARELKAEAKKQVDAERKAREAVNAGEAADILADLLGDAEDDEDEIEELRRDVEANPTPE